MTEFADTVQTLYYLAYLAILIAGLGGGGYALRRLMMDVKQIQTDLNNGLKTKAAVAEVLLKTQSDDLEAVHKQLNEMVRQGNANAQALDVMKEK